MENHYKNFLTTLYKFLYDLNRYDPSDNLENVLGIYKDLDKSKVIFNVYHLLNDNATMIKNRDDTLFTQPFNILPIVNVSPSWPKLIKGQRDKVMTYLNILLIESSLLIHPPPVQNSTLDLNQKNISLDIEGKEQQQALVKNANEPIDIDPFVGVSSGGTFGVDGLYSTIPSLDEDKPTGGLSIETISSMIGLDKMVNFGELTEQLKNMKKEDIESATNNMMNMLGNNADPSTKNLISGMLNSVKEELGDQDFSKGNVNIIALAKRVAERMQPSMNKCDLTQLLNTTKSFASVKDENGNPVFGGDDKTNPFMMMNQLATNIMQTQGKGENLQSINTEEYKKQAMDMLKNLGINNPDMNNLNLTDLMNQMNPGGARGARSTNSTRGNNNKGRGGKKKKH